MLWEELTKHLGEQCPPGRELHQSQAIYLLNHYPVATCERSVEHTDKAFGEFAKVTAPPLAFPTFALEAAAILTEVPQRTERVVKIVISRLIPKPSSAGDAKQHLQLGLVLPKNRHLVAPLRKERIVAFEHFYRWQWEVIYLLSIIDVIRLRVFSSRRLASLLIPVEPSFIQGYAYLENLFDPFRCQFKLLVSDTGETVRFEICGKRSLGQVGRAK